MDLTSFLAEITQHVFATRAMTLAGFVVLLYDHLLTFGIEVDLIWSKPPSLITVMFLVNRYMVPTVLATDIFVTGGLARNLSRRFCEKWLFCEGYLQILSFAIAHALVALRVRAIWGRNIIVTLILGVTFLAYFSTTMVIGTLAGMQLRASWRWEPTFHTCYVGKNPWTFWVWLPAVPLETVIFGLTILKAIRYTKENFKMPVTRLLYRDGALFFVVITSLSITNLTTWSLLPPTLTYLTRFCSFAIVTTMSSRLVLNLRSLGREEDPWLTDLSVMQFQLTAPNQSYSYWDPYLHDLDMDFDLVDDATRATWADPYTSMTALHDTASRRSRWSRSGSDGRRAGRGFYRTSSLLSPDWATEMRVPDRVRLSRMPSRSASLLETMDSRDEF